MQSLAADTIAKMKAALEDDLNTAQAQAAIFEMVRQANTAFDTGSVKKEDVPQLLNALTRFDEIFAVLEDDDAAKMKRVLEWAPTEGRDKEVSVNLRETVESGELNDADIEAKVAEMKTARGARDFKKSDAIRAELTEAGVLVEITKDGIRWRRK